MWIKHNKTLYNTDDISKIVVARTKIKATLHNGEEIMLGEFRAQKEAEDIFQSITRALLFEDEEHPGMIIRDTNKKRETKNDKH